MARFTLPRDLYHGKGSLEALKDFDGKREFCRQTDKYGQNGHPIYKNPDILLKR